MKKELYAISLQLQRISDRLIHFSSEESACIRDTINELQELIILLLDKEK